MSWIATTGTETETGEEIIIVVEKEVEHPQRNTNGSRKEEKGVAKAGRSSSRILAEEGKRKAHRR